MGWRHNELDKWTYYDDNTNEQKLGWQQIDGEYYYLYSDDIAKGWFKDKSDSNWYYFAPSKQVIDGKQWYKGQMLHGVWLDYKNKWYYFNEESGYGGFYKGQMIHSCTYTTPYGKTYQFDDEGALIENNKGISDKATEFIASWEGFYSKAYADPYYGASVKDYWTIGFGTCYCSNPSAFPNGLNSTCTREKALEWLKEEADKCYNKIKTNLTNKGIVLSSHQMDALSSFSFNCGVNALFGSSLYKYIIQGGTDANKIKTYFRMWNKANGQVSNG